MSEDFEAATEGLDDGRRSFLKKMAIGTAFTVPVVSLLHDGRHPGGLRADPHRERSGERRQRERHHHHAADHHASTTTTIPSNQTEVPE